MYIILRQFLGLTCVLSTLGKGGRGDFAGRYHGRLIFYCVTKTAAVYSRLKVRPVSPNYAMHPHILDFRPCVLTNCQSACILPARRLPTPELQLPGLARACRESANPVAVKLHYEHDIPRIKQCQTHYIHTGFNRPIDQSSSCTLHFFFFWLCDS